MTFEQLGLIRPILDALEALDYRTPSPIQEQAIPAALAGRDVLGCARTGTGKTCAFAAPILQRLSQQSASRGGIRALILTPTRELAIQIQENIRAYSVNLPLKSVVIFGGVGQVPQVQSLQNGCDVLVATPGRLMDLYGQGLVQLDRLEIFVLDEADRMLDMGFIHDVKKILTWLPKKKQTLLFSATMPREISALVDSLLRDPVKIAVDPVSSPVEVISQSVYFVDRGNKTALIGHLLKEKNISSALVFTRTKHGANKVARDLEKAGFSAAAIHGNKSQTARQDALAGFKSGALRILVATDIAARGLDIEEMPCVINYNLPEVPETYVHRIGRTGRAGHGGIAISLCDYGEKALLRDIEKLIRRTIPAEEGHPWPMEIFELPVRDARGKTVNPEDAEARAAAREKRRQESASRQVSEPLRTGGEKSPKVQVRPMNENKCDLMTERTEHPLFRKEKTPPPQREPLDTEETVAREEDLYAWHKDRRVFHRPERKPMSALDEIAPLPKGYVMPEPKYPNVKRTGNLHNNFLPELAPPEEDRRPVPPAGVPYSDATTRMFAARKGMHAPQPEPVKAADPGSQQETRKQETRKQERVRPAADAVQEKPRSAEPRGDRAPEQTGEKNKSRSSRSRKRHRPSRQGQSGGNQSAPKSPESGKKASAPGQDGAAQQKKSSGRKKRRHSHASRRPASAGGQAQGDGKSLMKPYYLSDRES